MHKVEGSVIVVRHSPGMRDDGKRFIVPRSDIDIWLGGNGYTEPRGMWYTAHDLYWDDTVTVS